MPASRFARRKRLQQRYMLIAIGGASGSIARYQIGALATKRFGMRFPVGTLAINISDCFLIGFSVHRLPAEATARPMPYRFSGKRHQEGRTTSQAFGRPFSV